MIAAYRAARLGQRQVLRGTLRQSHAALRRGREARSPLGETAEEASAPLPPDMMPAGSVDPASVFAGLVSLAVAVRTEAADPEAEQPASGPPAAPSAPPGETATATEPDTVTTASPLPAAPAAPEPVAPEPVASEFGAAESVAAEEAPDGQSGRMPGGTASSHDLPRDPPLAEIGFGPGMLIRLSHLGLRSIGDLARADAGQLRNALGDISRLVDVEAWINNARQTAGR